MNNSETESLQSVHIHGHHFRLMISKEEIESAVNRLAEEITGDLSDSDLLCIPILNGAFVFAADLVRALPFDPEVTFIRISSYQAMGTTGKVRQILGLSQDVKGRNVLVIEDIVDTGHTIAYLRDTLLEGGAKRVVFSALLFKKEAYQYQIPIDYVGFEIPDQFVVGCGLDYDGLGRTLPGIFVIDE